MHKGMTKITIVGAGGVGCQTAFISAWKELGDIILIDIIDGLPQGKALDLMEALPLIGSNARIKGTNDYSETQGSDLVVITAGKPRGPGMSREDLTEVNSAVMEKIVPEIVKHSPDAIIINVTNPLDKITKKVYELSGLPKKKVIGMAGVLDSSRFRAFLAEKTGADVNKIEAMVLGGHGDSMVPLIDHCRVEGKPLNEVLDKEKIEEIVKRVRGAGGEIIGLLKTGSTTIAPAAAVTEMIEAIVKDKRKILPCSVLLEGEYGFEGVFTGVPVKLGKKGVEEIVELDLSEKEKEELRKSVY